MARRRGERAVDHRRHRCVDARRLRSAGVGGPLMATVVTAGTRSSEPSAVRVADSTTDERWDAFVRSHSNCSFYHLSAWREVIVRSFGFQPRYLYTESAEHVLTGALPLFLVKSRLTGTKIQSL